jgi:hypothetical protein
MPTSNVFLGPSQSSIGYSIATGLTTGPPDIHVIHDRTRGAQLPQQQQHHHPHQHLSRHQHISSHGSSSLSPSLGSSYRLVPSLQHGPDPEVMEFISKIGQIIIKARTVSQPVPILVSSSSIAENSNNNSHGLKYSQQPHNQTQSLELALQDLDLWKSNTPVHVNILHSEQHVLLERWVISYTPAASSSSPMSPLNEPRYAKEPSTALTSRDPYLTT